MSGKHNKLEVAIMEEFGPRFAPDAKTIYIRDTKQKTLVLDKAIFSKLGITVSKHGKLPDMILYNSKKKWLFLIEVATTKDFISSKRQQELEKLLKKSKVGKIYVTVFWEFATYAKYADQIAWDTEVWIAEMPSHMIHFNGEKFLGPR
jgi:type II restriction enzyme